MKKLLAYVQVYMGPAGGYRPLGWLVMPISDVCVNVAGLIHDGARMSATTWHQVYSTISRELVKIHLRLMEMMRYKWLMLTSAYQGNFA